MVVPRLNFCWEVSLFLSCDHLLSIVEGLNLDGRSWNPTRTNELACFPAINLVELPVTLYSSLFLSIDSGMSSDVWSSQKPLVNLSPELSVSHLNCCFIYELVKVEMVIFV